MSRIARCHCGQVRITCEGEPHPVVLCSCELCQRRTGSPFQIGAWFQIDHVTIEGETRAFTRTSGDLGTEVVMNFCPDCGTSIWWGGRSEGPLAGRIGIAGGCFADRDFPPPTMSIYEKHRHPWINPPADVSRYTEMPPPEDLAGLFNPPD